MLISANERLKKRDRTDIDLKGVQNPHIPFSPIRHILDLQRTIGNHTVQRLIKSGSVHPNLQIGQPNDEYEQEAERVAERVSHIPEAETQNHIDALKKFSHRAQESPQETPRISPNAISRIQTLKGGGQPLPEFTRAIFAQRFGHEFRHVRVHTDSRATEAAKYLNANAFTIGNNVVFGAGQYAPHFERGKHLLAHELAHVVQQGPALEILQRQKATNEQPSQDKTLRQFLEDGRKAVEYTRNKIKLGMGNFKNDYSDPRLWARIKEGYDLYAISKEGEESPALGGIGAVGAMYIPEALLIIGRMVSRPEDVRIKKEIEEARQRGDAKEVLRLQQKAIELTAALAEKLKIGNCSEHASICYLYLRDKTQSRPLEMMLSPDHAFVALGRLPVNSADPKDWGNQTVICDAYYNEVYYVEGGRLHDHQSGVNRYQGRLEKKPPK
jgi:hypothetical protein